MLLISHGLGEHSGRYAGLAEWLNRQGVAVFALDHQGHGRSEGVRGHAASFSDLVDDLEAFRREVAAEADPATPVFLLGHSLGGLIAVRHLQRYPDAGLAGAVLSAPALGIPDDVGGWRRAAAGVLERIAPALPVSARLDPDLLSHDEAVVRAFRRDPLVHRCITPRLYREMMQAMERAFQERDRMRVSALLVLIPEADRIVSPDATVRFTEQLRSAVEVRRYPGFYHEPLNERERAVVFDDLLAWLRPRIG